VKAGGIIAIGNNTVRLGKLHDHLSILSS